MSRRRNRQEEEPMQGSWMTTYGDLVTLLMCFFVLLFSMSNIDSMKFKQMLLSFTSGNVSVIEELAGSNGILPENGGILSGGYALQEEEKFKQISEELQEFVDNNNLMGNVSVYQEHEGVLIRFNDSILFDKGSAYLKEDSLKILREMADLLHSYDRVIRVEGHTDNDPISTGTYPSNWELSTARAVNVVKYLVAEVPENLRISPELMQAAGYGEYYPLVENTNEHNKTRNRRIEIVILKKK